jgi:hypothetical protein
VTYADSILALIELIECNTGFLAARSAPDAPFLGLARDGDRLVWCRLADGPLRVAVHPDCVEGREVTSQALRALVGLVVDPPSDEMFIHKVAGRRRASDC